MICIVWYGWVLDTNNNRAEIGIEVGLCRGYLQKYKDKNDLRATMDWENKEIWITYETLDDMDDY